MFLLRWSAANLHRATVAPERVAHNLPVLRHATAPAVEALQHELSRATNADFASAVLARSKDAQRVET
jgi:hypothetical protein